MQNLLEFQLKIIYSAASESSAPQLNRRIIWDLWWSSCCIAKSSAPFAPLYGGEEGKTIIHLMKYYASCMIKVFATTNYRSFASTNKQRLSSHSSLLFSQLNIITQAINFPDEHSAACFTLWCAQWGRDVVVCMSFRRWRIFFGVLLRWENFMCESDPSMRFPSIHWSAAEVSLLPSARRRLSSCK